jgi:phosphoglycolate phosphatase
MFEPVKVNYQVILFDWNGTLLNDLHRGYETVSALLSKHQLPNLSLEEYRNEFCFPIPKFYQKLGFNLNSFEELTSDFIHLYHQDPLPQIFPEVENILKKCQHIAQLGILSAYNQNRLLEYVKKVGLNDYFDFIIGIEDDHAIGKSHRMREFIANTSIKPEKILLLGDTLHDAEVAIENGIHCHLIANGHQNKMVLKRNENKIPVFSDLSEWHENLIGK